VKRPKKKTPLPKTKQNKTKHTHITHMHTHTYRHTDSTTRNPVKAKKLDASNTSYRDLNKTLYHKNVKDIIKENKKKDKKQVTIWPEKEKKERPKEVIYLRKAVIYIQPKYSLSFFLQRS
jgi:hypothetical protein